MKNKIFISIIVVKILLLFSVGNAQAFSPRSSSNDVPPSMSAPFSPRNTPPSNGLDGIRHSSDKSAYEQTSSFQIGTANFVPFGSGGSDGDDFGDGAGNDNQGGINDTPVGNGIFILLAIAMIHVLFIMLRRRKAITKMI
jgi:hypothetical protein